MIGLKDYKIYNDDFQDANELECKKVVVFRAGGRHVPMQPWPQIFYVSSQFLDSDMCAVRPLTFTGIVKGIFMNFITMNLHRLRKLSYIIGFYDAEIDNSDSSWTLRFYKTLRKRKSKVRVHKAYGDLIDTIEEINKGFEDDTRRN